MSSSTTEDSKPHSKAGGWLFTALIAAVVATVVSFIVSLVVALVIAPLVGHGGNSAVIEEGMVDVPLTGNTFAGELKVFYRQPFDSPPSLTFPAGLDGCFVVEQQAASFTLGRDVRGHAGWSTLAHVKWKAEGVPAR